MKAIFDNLTSGTGKWAEQEYNTNSAGHWEADSIEVNMISARLSTQMHVTDWAEAQCEDPEIEATMDWCQLDKKSEPWTEQLVNLVQRITILPNWRNKTFCCDQGTQKDCYTQLSLWLQLSRQEELRVLISNWSWCPPPIGSSQLYFVQNNHELKQVAQSQTHLGNYWPFHEIYWGLCD